MRAGLIALTGVAMAALGLAPASAAPAQHDVYDATFDGTEHFTADENFCGPWATTFHEVRAGQIKIVIPPGGQQPGELHANGVVDGRLDLVPDDARLPSYSGTYREKLNAVITSIIDETDTVRVAQFRVRSTLRGTDGSQLLLVLSGKLTMNAGGTVVVSRDTFSCA